jgi:hypothetical protein
MASKNKTLKHRIMEMIFNEYLEGLVIELPKLEENPAIRNELISSAPSVLSAKAHKYVRDKILNLVKNTISFKTGNDTEIAYNRGIARGMQMYEEEMSLLTTLTVTHEKKKEG